MNKVRQTVNFIHNMGVKYLLFRLFYEFKVRINYFVLVTPSRSFAPLEEFPSSNLGFERNGLELPKANVSTNSKVERIKKGDQYFFNAEWIELGKDYNWISNPKTGYEYQLIHWSKIVDIDKEAGDIKYVWEKSRFTWLLDIIRFDYHSGKCSAEFVFNQIDHWIKLNPINLGPNYKCSQEMSLRICNWAIALDFYKQSPFLNSDRIKKYHQVIYGHVHHIFKNIQFSRIAVRNNHAITETAILFISRWLFPFIPEINKWSKKAEKWFNKEIAYQIYSDGTFLQFSMNYHRVVLQTLSLVISISHRNNYTLDKVIYERAYSSINFLYNCMGNKELGLMPNYGQNDGAWFFPWTSTTYRDFRPQINALHFILTGQDLFDDDVVKEERRWWGAINPSPLQYKPPLILSDGIKSFSEGGYYLYREGDTLLFFRNGHHKDRPSQADNHHLDLWHKGENILIDAGTYNYNTSEKWIKWFFGTSSHNVAQIGLHDQMLKGGRFIWYYWSQAKSFAIKERHDYIEFTGSISAFRHLNKNCCLTRTIRKHKGINVVDVIDSISELPNGNNFIQNWHFKHESKIEVESQCDIEFIDGWFSEYYGIKNKAVHTRVISQSNTIETTLKY